MVREIYQTYHLPIRPEELTLNQIKFWYSPMIPMLIEMQRDIAKNKSKK